MLTPGWPRRRLPPRRSSWNPCDARPTRHETLATPTPNPEPGRSRHLAVSVPRGAHLHDGGVGATPVGHYPHRPNAGRGRRAQQTGRARDGTQNPTRGRPVARRATEEIAGAGRSAMWPTPGSNWAISKITRGGSATSLPSYQTTIRDLENVGNSDQQRLAQSQADLEQLPRRSARPSSNSPRRISRPPAVAAAMPSCRTKGRTKRSGGRSIWNAATTPSSCSPKASG